MSPARVDLLVAATLLALSQAESWLSPAAEGQRFETAVAGAVMTSALAARRRQPLLVTAIALTAVTALALTAGLPNVAFLLPTGLVVMYTLGAHAENEQAIIGLVAAVLALPIGAVNTDDPSVTDLTAPVFVFVAAWGLGRVIRTRRRREGELEDHAAQLVREQEERERAAVAEERARIARELHDIVAHRVTSIVVQAESGRVTADEPARAGEGFMAIGDSGRQALAELRRLLDVLHAEGTNGSAAGTEPQPGLAGLDDLTSDVRRAGLPLTVEVQGDLGGLPAGLDLAAYRIVQEALTNAVRHGGTSTTMRVARDGPRLDVEVRNRLSKAASRTEGSGRGLAGMRERVRLYGGRLTAAPEGDEFVLHAVLPVEDGGA